MGDKNTSKSQTKQTQSQDRLGRILNHKSKGIMIASKKGIGRAALKGLARKAGVRKLGIPIMGQFREAAIEFITEVVKNSIAYSEACQRKSIQLLDVLHALRAMGRPVYGYGL